MYCREPPTVLHKSAFGVQLFVQDPSSDSGYHFPRRLPTLHDIMRRNLLPKKCLKFGLANYVYVLIILLYSDIAKDQKNCVCVS